MGNARALRKSLAAAAALLCLTVVPGAGAAYENGAFVGKMVGASGSSQFTLPGGSLFPQVSAADVPLGADSVVSALNGAVMDFHLSVGEFAEVVLPGTMGYSFFQVDTPDGPRSLYVGTYFVTMKSGAGAYVVSGPVVGDNTGIYFAGKSDMNTPADTADTGPSWSGCAPSR